jgi:hypothetical protein
MKKEEIEKIVHARIEDARILYEASRFDGSIYLCGYAIELGLKARICRTLQWDEYPTTGERNRLNTFLSIHIIEFPECLTNRAQAGLALSRPGREGAANFRT